MVCRGLAGSIVAIAVVVLAVGCRDRARERAEARARASAHADAAVIAAPPPDGDHAQPLPPAALTAADGAIGRAGAFTLVDAASDGAWVALCQPSGESDALFLVVGVGPGIRFDRLIAATDRDVIAVEAQRLVHVDIPNRTQRWLGMPGHAAIDAASRRIVYARGAELVVRDPGAEPRVLRSKTGIATITLRGRRWAEVERGAVPASITESGCGYARVAARESAEHVVVDLDPAGVEAPERVGPAIGVTATGEVTLDGTVVLDAACGGNVLAALADPPRMLAVCQDKVIHVIGPGGIDHADKLYWTAHSKQAWIDPALPLGQRLYCELGTCVDLIDGTEYAINDSRVVWSDEHQLVREQTGGLLFDDLDSHQQVSLILPHVAQVVTVDSATGARRVGPAPPTPTFIDQAGDFILYGRYLVDRRRGALVEALGDDALAVDDRGRVLVPSSHGQGPLRWTSP